MPQNPLNDLFQPQPQRPPQGGQNPFQMLQEFQKFSSGMTPEKARQQVEQLLASGKMSRQQFQQLQQQAKQLMQFFGLNGL